jgi:sugar phosphate isomerase/epimerase
MESIKSRLHISTVAPDARRTALEFGLGIELAEFCTARNMDTDFARWDGSARANLEGIANAVFHAPFNELCPAAIDPKILETAKNRYAQAYALMRSYGINKMVVHSGYVPLIYFKEFFAERSVEFWREFLRDKPEDAAFFLENVLEDEPDLLRGIVEGVDDPRFRLCVDIGHANTIVSELPVAAWIDRCAPVLGHVHLHNNYRAWDHHNALDDGTIDMRAALRQLADAAPGVTYTIESRRNRASVLWLAEEGFL